MKDTWQKVFAQSQKHLVFFKEIVGKHDYGIDCVIHAMDHSFNTCAVFENIGDVKRCSHARGFVKLAFKCDYDYLFPTVFKDENELVAAGLKMCPISIIYSQDENGDRVVIPTAILCGKITAIEAVDSFHIFEVEYGDKIFSIVFTQEVPNAKVGDILHGEFDVLASLQ